MAPYLLLLLFVVTVAHVGRISNSRDVRFFTIGIVIITLIAFAGLRSFQVGTDTENYRIIFTRSGEWDFLIHNFEIGYGLLSWVVRSQTDSFLIMLVVIAAIVVICYVATIIRMTYRYEIALYIFIVLGSYTFFLNGARQGIAAAICFAALPFLLQRRVIPYVLTIIIATLFHQTALIAIVLYPMASARVHQRRLWILVAVTVGLVISIEVFVNLAAQFLDAKFAVYAVEGKGGGRLMAAFLISQGVILYCLKDKVRDYHRHYARLLNIYLIGLVPALVSMFSNVNPSGLLRLHIYFSHVTIIMWPMALMQLKNIPDHIIILLSFFIVTILFFILTTVNFSNLVPYNLNPEIVL